MKPTVYLTSKPSDKVAALTDLILEAIEPALDEGDHATAAGALSTALMRTLGERAALEFPADEPARERFIAEKWQALLSVGPRGTANVANLIVEETCCKDEQEEEGGDFEQ